MMRLVGAARRSPLTPLSRITWPRESAVTRDCLKSLRSFHTVFSSNSTQPLRLNGYIVNESGRIECTREGERYEQSRTAIIQIDGGREIVDRLIAVADSPRALVGRTRDGSAVLLFRHDGGRNFTPYIPGYPAGVLDLVLNSNGE